MDNQHRKVSGYRELSQEEIDLMNRIKAKGAELLALQEEARRYLAEQSSQKHNAILGAESLAELDELKRFEAAEPFRWVSIGKTDIQTGLMALVRAVAQPAGV
ncbi:MAG TPA: hypothetical protein DHW73_04130 [Pseudomonas sp.]|nr:hypothetical protein [Pseudomonadales bacterium]HCB41685.1 hypothetical protein [Pseudomonas sp.]HCL40545.1 hypothetical protein [Pseudomonas sp.]|tara:strand:+ start:742 stop:1050 length:309 start_codon:yes stop_codon:yes gene_type:complete